MVGLKLVCKPHFLVQSFVFNPCVMSTKNRVNLEGVKPLTDKYATSAVPFTFTPADLVGVPSRLLRLMRSRFTYVPDSYFQGLVLDGPEIQALMDNRKKASGKLRNIFSGSLENNGRPVVALLCGDMLHAEESDFLVGMFGLTAHGSDFRYAIHKGLNAAQLALTKWAERNYRIGNGFVTYK